MSRENNSVILSTYSMDGYTKGLPGVERVMDTQQQLMQSRGIDVRMLVGATDHPNPEKAGIMIMPEIKSGHYPLWDANGGTSIEPATLERLLKNLTEVVDNIPVIFHNTTNAVRHNPPYGVTAANIVDERIRSGSKPALLWVHDLRESNPEQMQALLPKEHSAKLVIVSNVRRLQIEATLQKVQKESGIVLPDYDLQVIPNPIDAIFSAEDIPVPPTFNDAVPNFDTFTETWGLEQDRAVAEEVLMGPNSHEYCKMIIPARVVAQKGIEKGLAVARSYAMQNEQKTAFIVTGAPDLRKPENQAYWERIQRLAKECTQETKGKLQILFLGGVAWEYMPWLYKTSTILLGPFKNEGFSLTPIEAGMVGLNAAISEDPAQLETTQGNALLIPDEEWELPDIAARRIKAYIGSSQASRDIEEIRRVAHENFSPEAITRKTLQLLDLA